jgi:hypothetical protein
MNVFEQLALGAQCPWRTLRESFRGELWRPWARYLLGCVIVLLAIGFAPHPFVSWAMAPLVRWAAGDDALRYPELYSRLPGLWKWAQLVLDAAVAPFAAGVAALLWSERFRGAPLHAREARQLMQRHWLALLLASLPVTLVAVFGHLGLEGLARVRLSGLSRALAPQLLVGAVFVVKAAYFYAVPMVMLDPRGARCSRCRARGRTACCPRSSRAGRSPCSRCRCSCCSRSPPRSSRCCPRACCSWRSRTPRCESCSSASRPARGRCST